MSKSNIVFTEKAFKHQVHEIVSAKDGVKESQLDKLADLLETREPRLNACPLCNHPVQKEQRNMMRRHLKRECKVVRGEEQMRIGRVLKPRAAAVAASSALSGEPRPAAAVVESKAAVQGSGRKRERWYYQEIPDGDSTGESSDEDDEMAGAVAMSELSDSAEENVEPPAKIAKKEEVKEAVVHIQPAPAAAAEPVQVAEPVPVAAPEPAQVAAAAPPAAAAAAAAPVEATAAALIQMICADQGKLTVQEAKYLAARSESMEVNRAELNALHACADECIEQWKFYVSRLERNRLTAVLSFNAGDLPQARELLESASNLGKEVYKGTIAIKSLKNYYIKKNGGEETTRFTAQAIDHMLPKEPVVTGVDRAVFVMGYENAAKMGDDLIAKFETCHWVLWNLKERIKGVELIKAQSVENFNAGKFQVAKGMFLAEFFVVGVAKRKDSAPAPAASQKSPAVAAAVAAATASVNAQLERARTPSPPPKNPAPPQAIIPAPPQPKSPVMSTFDAALLRAHALEVHAQRMIDGFGISNAKN